MITEFISNGSVGNGIVELSQHVSIRTKILTSAHVNISILTLNSLDSSGINELLNMINSLRIENGELKNFEPMRRCRIQPEHNRQLALEWFQKNNKFDEYHSIDVSLIRPYDKTRLFGIMDTIKYLPLVASEKLIQFSYFMKPINVSEFASYIEFGYKKLGNLIKDKNLGLEPEKFKDELLKKDQSLKMLTWRQTVVGNHLDFDELRHEFMDLKKIVHDNNMSGIMNVKANLSDADLVAEIMSRVRKNETIKFGSDFSAAYHIFKRPGDDMKAFVADANEIIRTSDAGVVSLTQKGTARNISFTDGKVVALEVDGSVFLCTYIKNKKSK